MQNTIWIWTCETAFGLNIQLHCFLTPGAGKGVIQEELFLILRRINNSKAQNVGFDDKLKLDKF